MKLGFLVLLAAAAFMCSTCQPRPTPVYNRHGLYRITVASSTCFGPCAAFALDVDSSLSCTYYGGKYARHQGYYRGQVSELLWLEAVKQANQLNLDSLPDTYAQNADAPSVQFILYTSGGEKHFLGSDGALPDPLFKLYIWIATHDSVLALRPAADSIRFATLVQHEPPAPPLISHDRATPAN